MRRCAKRLIEQEGKPDTPRSASRPQLTMTKYRSEEGPDARMSYEPRPHKYICKARRARKPCWNGTINSSEKDDHGVAQLELTRHLQHEPDEAHAAERHARTERKLRDDISIIE